MTTQSTMFLVPDTLFPVALQDSPRLAWLKKHKIKTRHYPGVDDEPSGFVISFETQREVGESFHFGITEDDALADWSRKNGVRMWHEEFLNKPAPITQ